MINNSKLMEQLNLYYTAWQECNYVYEAYAKSHGLSFNSLLVISALSEDCENCTQKKISQRWMIPKQTVNMILKDLERNGLVELRPLPSDKRNKVIKLTAAGKGYAASVISELRKVELSAVEEMGMEKMQQLNENTTLFVELFRKAGGIDKND
ncbi:MarR family winged helix-turn-helix transcriptional regulator [Ihubacter sp. rT4E-8]|uniref:MarR family winged helix-turn-helix transcriptional regulator n=1 Tax=Ihubacter sp. rT4E-8 TaxID=3242369 RepID=UPI003CFAE417